MKKLIKQLKGNSNLIASVQNCEKVATAILSHFITNFPEFTDHSIIHSRDVLNYAEYLLDTEIKKLNEDEAYVLIMAGFLHDIGMCPTDEMKDNIKESTSFKESGKIFEDFLRDIHHELSFQYITTLWNELKIENEIYAEAIALVAMGHRKVDLLDFDEYNPEYVVKSGSDFVCLPYLASLLRLADELDITNDRTPELLYNEYYPTNKISKEEWDKHKANYFVTFNKPTIKITSKCFEKNLYYALLKQYNKIDGVIKYTQKVVNTIPLNERRLKVDFLKLEKDIKTFGFIPKEIGFSFDLQNTINTFIGDNLYKDKFVAIRECLQNAIDTCRYRKKLTKTIYSPQITIILEDKLLTISDNGLGMDEFIIENYFSKLAKSYYKESKVLNEFEAISQFGIGVFSYFLLCNFFEVETKQEGKAPVKFRSTKDTDSFFHFYDNPTKTETSTTITFFLKNEITFDELLNQVRHYIRFVEFPIDIIYKERHEIISANDFIIDKLSLIGKHISREYIEVLQNLITIDAQIFDDEFDGILGLLIFKDNDGIYIPIKNYDTLKTYNTSVIELSQKGIYIGNDRDRRLNNIIGHINLKQKNDVDLGRCHIKNTKKIQDISERFYEIIFKKLFENWRLKTPEIKRNLSRNLIGYYFDHYEHFKLEFIETYFDELYFQVYTGKKIEFFSLSKIIEFDEFIIVRSNIPFHEYGQHKLEIEEKYALFQKPLLIEGWAPPAGFILYIFNSRKNKIKVNCTPKHWYYSIKPHESDLDEKRLNLLASEHECYEFDYPHICAYTNLWSETPFNLNHEIVKYYMSKKKKINNEQFLFKAFDDFFKSTHYFFFKFHTESYGMKNPESEIIYLNSLLHRINEILGTYFVLSKKDFPEWVNEKINWENITNRNN